MWILWYGKQAFKERQFSKDNLSLAYYREYYITDTGQKSHKKDCIFIQNKKNVRQLTKEKFESDRYELCKTNLSD